MVELAFITLASALAGFLDAIVGGGGLILMPALFAAFPSAPAATLMGTNKSASIWGSAFAAAQYAKKIQINWQMAWPSLLACFVGSGLGTSALLYVSNETLRRALPFVLALLLVYTLSNKNLGQSHAPRFSGVTEIKIACAIGLLIGFYDGFFGPGTGSFFIFLFVRVMGYDFLSASTYAKLFNTATNLSAVALLAFKGHIWWHISLYLILANLAGSFWGSRLAIRRGSSFVRGVYVIVVSLLIVKTFWDGFIR